ncbi:MAG: glycosyltransferase family 39 protein [Kiritimatiellae bacterium]|jgi:4-amino-4-deoxy-L-arabinose transferase-like glycosyltransferase|nr:glycosyltransferase family 39 protein [Kiritimatiellia bacterium]
MINMIWITPSVWMNGQLIPFLGKPPLQFWLSAISVKLFGLNEFALRLPAFLSGLLLLSFVYLTLKKTNDKETALAGTAITASTAIFLGVCGAVATDMTFSAMTGIAILSYILFSVETTKIKQKHIELT